MNKQIYLLVVFTLALTLLMACLSDTKQSTFIKISGETMGTKYNVTAQTDLEDVNLKIGIDSLLVKINDEVNTYDPQSMISNFNHGDDILLPIIQNPQRLIKTLGGHFAANLLLSQNPYNLTSGSFDPTLGPLIEHYGFGPSKAALTIDSTEIKQLLNLVGFEKIVFDTINSKQFNLSRSIKGLRLDLSAIAKGYAVDQIALFLEQNQVKSYFVEIGGETRAKGQSPRNKAWTIGINRPDIEASINDITLILAIDNAAIATSGNYRNQRNIDGKTYVHTIDPSTGLAQPSNLLSATVLASDCATADAFATACMVSGEKAVKLIERAKLDACLIFSDQEEYKIVYVGNFENFVVATN